jgi:outer membrane protein assembly complex protein YaeT
MIDSPIIAEPDTVKVVKSISMIRCSLLIAVLLLGASKAIPAPLIRYVKMEGNTRIPAASILRRISAIPNTPLNRANLREDLKMLHSLGLFKNIKIVGRSAGQGRVDLIYQVCEYPFISSFSIEGVDESIEKQIREHLRNTKRELHPATPFNPACAQKTALAVRNFLRSRKHPNAQVQISTEGQGSSIRVLLRVLPGMRLKVGKVRFLGSNSISERELLHQMQYARPAPFWARWGGAARFVPEELNSDLDRIRSYYMSHGFATATIGTPHIFATSVREKQQLEIEIPIMEGARYSLISLDMEGNLKAGSADLKKIIRAVEIPREYDYTLLESTRQKIIDVLGHHGYAMARVQLMQSVNHTDCTIEAVYRIDPGNPIIVGRIVFQGNRRIADKFLRRELRLGEGDIFDTAKLDQSLEHLNKNNLLHKIFRSDVALKMNSKTHLLDVTFHVKEKDRQGIYLTGGPGGIGGGYLGILYTAFNLTRLGETLSLELDGGAAQSNMLLNIIGNRFLGSPFTLALSVFSTATGFNVASIVPGPDDLVGMLRRRRTGAGLSGAYPLTEGLQAGLGFEVREDLIEDLQTVNSVPSRSVKSELTPFILLDRTSGSGPETRGFRAHYRQAWDGSLSWKSLNSTRESAQLACYARDPWIYGKNSFAFRLQFEAVRPLGAKPLFLEHRFYPGSDILRGFNRGSLSPWASVPTGTASSLQATGADTVLAFSAEYRMPIHGALSSLAFFDLGWTYLDPKNTIQLGTGARLIESSNGAIRSSLGGELRLQLPILRQPARLIFAWNPLRLSTLLADSSSVLRLVEPQTALRFALGGSY